MWRDAALIVDSSSGICRLVLLVSHHAVFPYARHNASRAVFSSIVGRPVVDTLLLCSDRYRVQKTAGFRSFSQLQVEGHQHPCRGAEADSHGLDCSSRP